MLDFIKSDVSIKKLAHSTVDQLASYSLDQLKGIIAKALTDDWNKTLAAKEVKKIFSDNELFVSSEKATSKLFWCEMISVLAQYYFWNKPIKQLDRDGNEVVEGVDEVLSNGDGGDTVATVKSLEQDTQHYQLTPKLQLFVEFVDYTYLMHCFFQLIEFFELLDIKPSLRKAQNNLYFAWCSLVTICLDRYIMPPHCSRDDYFNLLRMSY